MNFTFTKKTTIVTMLTLLNFNSIVLAKGIDTGNGDDKLTPFAGFKSKTELETKARVIPQQNRLFNKVTIENKLDYSQEVQQLAIKSISLYELMGSLNFPSDKLVLKNLYNLAVNKQGDFTSITSSKNPFSQFISQSDKKNIDRELSDPRLFSYPIAAIHEVTEGINLNFNFISNKDIQENKCEACKISDYKKIPTDGIALKIQCSVGSSHDSDILNDHDYDYTPEKFDYDLDFKVYGNLDRIKNKIPLVSYEMAERMRLKFCDEEGRAKLDFVIRCSLVPADSGKKLDETRKMKEAFGVTEFSLEEQVITFINPKSDSFVKEKFASKLNEFRSLERKTEYKSPKGFKMHYTNFIPLWPSSTKLVGYSFNFPSGNVLGKESDFADLVRRGFINSYNQTEF